MFFVCACACCTAKAQTNKSNHTFRACFIKPLLHLSFFGFSWRPVSRSGEPDICNISYPAKYQGEFAGRCKYRRIETLAVTECVDFRQQNKGCQVARDAGTHAV